VSVIIIPVPVQTGAANDNGPTWVVAVMCVLLAAAVLLGIIATFIVVRDVLEERRARRKR